MDEADSDRPDKDQQGGFDRRLREARARRGLDAPPKAPGGGLPAGAWGIGFRAGLEVVSALVVGIAIGLLLDRWLGTWPWFFLLFFVAGSAAGVLNVYRLFSPRSGRR
ncbi:MAG TPA: AtpZ/AtpI family protein [Crenalkalicoccus sp.]|nr:AtpZ/AtpI family protein [Crenalkalicoccus sp.]